MVFSTTFFTRREEVAASYRAKGYTELGDLLEQHRLTMDHLVPAGVLAPREEMRVPCVCHHEPTAMGAPWLVEERRHDLIMVKPGCQAHIVALALAAPPPDPEMRLNNHDKAGWLWAYALVQCGLPRTGVERLQRSIKALYTSHGIVLTLDVFRAPQVLFCSALPARSMDPAEALAHSEAALAALVRRGIVPYVTVLDASTGKAHASRKHGFVAQGKARAIFRVAAPRAVYRTEADGTLQLVALEDESLPDAKRATLQQKAMAWANRAAFRK